MTFIPIETQHEPIGALPGSEWRPLGELAGRVLSGTARRSGVVTNVCTIRADHNDSRLAKDPRRPPADIGSGAPALPP